MTDKKHYRHENKYYINPGTYMVLRQRLKAAMSSDSHAGENGEYRITSLYFDDIYRTAYNDKISGVGQRKKYRIRVYGQNENVIKLEEKMKDGDFTCKESIFLTVNEYRKMLACNYSFLAENRFVNTAGADFLASTSMVALKPAVVVDYIREAYICNAGNVRITFDKELKAGTSADITNKNALYYDALYDRQMILEVKYDAFIPEYIRELLGGLSLQRESASKYVLCADKLVELVGTDRLGAPDLTINETRKETTQCIS